MDTPRKTGALPSGRPLQAREEPTRKIPGEQAPSLGPRPPARAQVATRSAQDARAPAAPPRPPGHVAADVTEATRDPTPSAGGRSPRPQGSRFRTGLPGPLARPPT